MFFIGTLYSGIARPPSLKTCNPSEGTIMGMCSDVMTHAILRSGSPMGHQEPGYEVNIVEDILCTCFVVTAVCLCSN